jgi:hypothetical protein
MSTDQPSRLAIAMTWLVLLLVAVLTAWGIIQHGLSLEVHQRFWSDIQERIHGPMTFRFVLQPAMAFLAALADGIRDARQGHKAFFWTALRDPTQQRGRLREGLISTARVCLLGICMDVIYQLRVLDEFYPAEAVMMAILLAVIPYFVFRWIVESVARWWLARSAKGTS